LGSIPIARSKNFDDSVALTLLNLPRKTKNPVFLIYRIVLGAILVQWAFLFRWA
jgi:hypothetical protein